MKDAFGSAFIIKLMLVFMVVFICFMTVAVNFAKVFRVKNTVINILERYSGEESVDEINERIDAYLTKIGYDYSSNTNVTNDCNNQRSNLSGVKDGSHTYSRIQSICVIPLGDDDNTYYKVTAYIVLDFPLFRFGTVMPISGESATIVS